ncbi:MAG: RimK family alpha-L-glutamate ligase [Myxococcales bacterium]|nr:RimK family alpha-L-glutamate ligase [Myxococcales bacterium]MCB9731065.1 RimK family alpha-L-glutamate ligase [Deltaproteobacteria bacterium]
MLRVTLLSQSARYYTSRRLLEAGRALGYDMVRLDPERAAVVAGADAATVAERGKLLPTPDVVVPRIGSQLTDWGLAILETWVAAGAHCAVTPGAVGRAADKLRTSQCLARHGVPALPTVAIRDRADIAFALSVAGGTSWVVKARFGTHGRNVVLAPDRRSATSILEALVDGGRTVLVQPFVALDEPRDLRVLVLGGEPVAAAWRYAGEHDFRANVHRGGKAAHAELTPEAGALAVRASAALDLPFCGVDLIETDAGWSVVEVNGSPGLEGVETLSGRDFATPYLERWMKGLRSGGAA